MRSVGGWAVGALRSCELALGHVGTVLPLNPQHISAPVPYLALAPHPLTPTYLHCPFCPFCPPHRRRRLFRTMGLRHLFVAPPHAVLVSGMVTRKDIIIGVWWWWWGGG